MDKAPTRRRPLTRWLRAPMLALVAAVVANCGLLRVDWIGYLELSTFERRLVSLRPAPASSDIILIVVDRTSMRKLGLPAEHRSLRWLRSRHAELIASLREAGARSLAFDIIFDEAHVPDEDQPLRRALQESRPLPITLAANRSKAEKSPGLPGGYSYWFNRPVVLPRTLPENVTLGAPVAFDPDLRLTGVRLLFHDRRSGAWIPHVSFGAVLGPSGKAAVWDKRDGRVVAGQRAWPVGADGELFVRWTAKMKMFRVIEYSDALSALRDPLRADVFRNKIVLVGAEDDLDRHTTALGEMAGYEFVAQAINTLLLPPHEQVRRVRIPWNFAWGWVLALLTAALVQRRRAGIIGLPLVVFAGLMLPILLLRSRLVWLDTVGPLLSIAVSLAAAAVLEAAVVGELARRFAPRLAWQGRPARLTEEATILFADMSGYTRIAESLHPHEVQRLQRDLTAALSSAVKRHQGEVERTMGDAIMAVFRGGRHAVRCAQSAVSLLSEFETFKNDRGLDGMDKASLRVGFESGVISTGLIEFAGREDYSSAGHAVNLASRLEGACESQGVSVLLGPTARALIADDMSTEFVGSVNLKNVKDPVPVYTLKDAPRPTRN
ncbi:MAG: adenylate/guanylate cyclase domain-containing protein [Armatimonadetes bacterium]|nr:adenylate/guanylate cyclase domain-containing protein [Armatimonadota bacterium]